jgi:single-stranded-DNA-specific exonuclease
MSSPTSLDHSAWVFNSYSWEKSQTLADALRLPLVAAMVLAGRGLTDPEEARMFLECSYPLPDPFLFGHMEAAVRTVSDAVEESGRIVVHGDYDADGITATALLVLGLRDFGVEAEWYLPSRFKEGYGLSRAAVETIASAGPGVLITVDCGVNYPDEVRLARDMGLEVVVVDHHQPGPVLPDCSLIHEVVGQYPHGDLCGVGLALKVLHALHIHRFGAARNVLPSALQGLLDLVAIGTIADLAPLQGENRYYVKEGLKLIGIGRRVGLRELASVAACTGVVDSGTVAFRLAPRLNAAGRLADPSPPLRLLLTEDEHEARTLAAGLHELNGARQDVERQILDDAVGRIEALHELPSALVLAGAEWHEGVVGIVASRLVERYHRPTILLGLREGVAKGSGRSIPAYDLLGSLNACSRFLTIYGGHKQAVGLTLEVDQVEAFRLAVEEHAASALVGYDLIPTYRADAVLRGEDVNADTALALSSLGPFGTGNHRPRLLVVDGTIQNAEATRNGAHLRCMVEVDGVKARGIGFGLGWAAETVRQDGDGRVLGVQFRVDEWQGILRPEFLLERIGSNGVGAVPQSGCAPESCHAALANLPGEIPKTTTYTPPANATLHFPAGRDLRDRPGRFSALAQVLASGERAVVLTCSLPHTLAVLQDHLPLRALAGDELECVGRACLGRHQDSRVTARVTLMEWEVPPLILEPAQPGTHLIAMDPPFRSEHVAFLRAAADKGAAVHLYYGNSERQATARLLRYLVHPRFAMVCLFRAMREGECGEAELFSKAASMAWHEAQVILTHGDLVRAAGVLEELGGEQIGRGDAKLDARNIPAYLAAEADYEECSRLCLTL